METLERLLKNICELVEVLLVFSLFIIPILGGFATGAVFSILVFEKISQKFPYVHNFLCFITTIIIFGIHSFIWNYFI